MINWWENHFGDNEIKRVISSIKNRNISQGSVTKEFEDNISKYLNIKTP